MTATWLRDSVDALGFFGPMAITVITSRIYTFVNSFIFVSVPMFVLMAAMLDRSGVARDLFDALKLIGGRIRGGIAMQTIFVSVILAARHHRRRDRAAGPDCPAPDAAAGL